MLVGRLRKGSYFNGYKIIKRLDHKTKTFRAVYLCKEGVLIIYDNHETPEPFMVEYGDCLLPYEYFVMECNCGSEIIYGLPRLIECEHDENFSWLLVEEMQGQTLKESVAQYKAIQDPAERVDCVLPLCGWLLTYIHFWKIYGKPNMKLNLTPDNLFISSDKEGNPQLKIIDLHSALSLEYGLDTALLADLNAKYVAPEIFTAVYNDKSMIYTIAMLMVYCLNFGLPDDDFVNGSMYEDIVHLQIKKNSYLDNVPISDAKKKILYSAIDSNPAKRPTFEKFRHMWETDTFVMHNSHTELSDSLDTVAPNANKFDGMFVKACGNGFDDVGGMDELKQLFREKYIYPLKYPDIAEIYHLSPPNGILLYGYPGCGKSFIAKKICEELHCAYIEVKASHLGGSFYRESVTAIGELFDAAARRAEKDKSPVFIILNECDGLISVRDQEMSKGAAADTNLFLVEMENCASRGIHLICTTNDPSGIDSAALRSGRIDEVVFLPLPNNKTKEAILSLFLQRLPHEEAIDLSAVVGHMINFTSSDIEKAVNAAANMALSMMIDNHVKNRSSAIIKINEQILMDVVANMSPSLTEETRARHEQIHRQYSTNMKTHRKRIGFNT